MSYYSDDYNPRPTTEVYQLRREGKIDDAYSVAVGLYGKYPNSDEVKKAYAWTMIDLCKRELAAGNTQAAMQWASSLSQLSFREIDDFTETILKNVRSLRMKLNPYAAKIQQACDLSKAGQNNEAYAMFSEIAAAGQITADFHENYGWVIYRYLRDNIESLNSRQVRTNLRDYIQLTNQRPSNLHSQILNFALNYSKKDPEFKLVSFLQLWDPQCLRSSDFDDAVGKDGKKIPSLMSRIAREVVRYPQDAVVQFIELLPLRKQDFIEMLRNACFWDLYKIAGEARYKDLWTQFDTYLEDYGQYGPSESHSKILSLAERTMKDENQYRFYGFLQKWDPKNFRKEDWKEERGENGDTYKPLAMKAIKKAYDALEAMRNVPEGSFAWLVDAYGEAVTNFPFDDWSIRTKAQLLLKAGQKSDADRIYRSLARKMGDKYYIWHEFADCVEDENARIGMLCKALTLEKNEDFIGKIRLDLAEALIRAGRLPNAALEIKLHKDHYSAKGWAVKPRVESLSAACGTISDYPADNNALYKEYSVFAEEYAYSDIPYTDMVLVDEWKNPEGKIKQKFVDSCNDEIVITKKRFPALKNAKPGQVWGIKLYNGIKTIPLLVKRTDLPDWSVLPVAYGYVNHVNEEKKVYHVYTQDSTLVYEQYDKMRLSKGDFVSFRQYTTDGEKIRIYDLRKSTYEAAVPNFKSAVAVVDGVNESKKLFHFVLGPGQPSGIVRYDQTDLRPEEGDCVRIYHYVKERKEARKPGEDKRIVEVLKVEATAEKNPRAMREISGLLEVKYHGGYDPYDFYDDDEDDSDNIPDFAFVGDFYIHRNLLEKYKITHNCRVRGIAVYGADGKWKTVRLEII